MVLYGTFKRNNKQTFRAARSINARNPGSQSANQVVVKMKLGFQTTIILDSIAQTNVYSITPNKVNQFSPELTNLFRSYRVTGYHLKIQSMGSQDMSLTGTTPLLAAVTDINSAVSPSLPSASVVNITQLPGFKSLIPDFQGSASAAFSNKSQCMFNWRTNDLDSLIFSDISSTGFGEISTPYLLLGQVLNVGKTTNVYITGWMDFEFKDLRVTT